jgi:streptogramin lyase
LVAGARHSGRVAVFIAVSAAVVVAAASAAPVSRPSVTEVRLAQASPQEIALGSDGSIWATDEYGVVRRLEPNGRIRTYAIGSDEYAADLASGPDGAIWLAANDIVVRIDAAGHRRSWPVGGLGLAQAITSAGGALWLADVGRIDRVGTDGSLRAFKLGGARKDALIPGITAGPDGALWFTQTHSHSRRPDGIGRLTMGGQTRSWALPGRRMTPLRIAAGPDGALWFTEQDGHAIGRITTAGAITHFLLGTGLSPYDIKPGPDGALWFTADSCIGRITTSGDLTAWPIRRAGRLLGIVPAPDGTIWAADDLKGALWHFVPPADGAAPAKPCTPPTIVRRSRSTRATLVYRRVFTFKGTDWFTDARVRITRRGKTVYAESVPPRDGYADGDTSSFAVQDLDGDREPEVRLELNSNGAHCCTWSRIYSYSSGTYRPFVHYWGDDAASPELRDLNGDGRPEFRSVDARFAYAFSSYAGSWMPIQIWSYRHGRFRDVTRRFPVQVRRDAARVWRFYVRHRRRRGDTVRGVLPAWAADEYLLGRGSIVWPTLEREARAGYLDLPKDQAFFGPRKADVYIRQLRAFLRKLGYL